MAIVVSCMTRDIVMGSKKYRRGITQAEGDKISREWASKGS